MRLLLVTPPMTQLNTPYPATAVLTGYLRGLGHEVRQADPALELFLRLFSRATLRDFHERLTGSGRQGRGRKSPAVRFFLEHADACIDAVEPVIGFLQGRDPTLATRIVGGDLVPRGPRFEQAMGQFGGDGDPLAFAFGGLGHQDRAKYLASLFVDDLADMIRDGIDERFGLARYGEKLAASSPTFAPLAAALAAEPTPVDELLAAITRELIETHCPQVVGMSAPFPGNVYGAFSMARTIRRLAPGTTLVLGGGWVNTELRTLREPAVFDDFDFITLDDGEGPLAALLEHLGGSRPRDRLIRTYVRDAGAVRLINGPGTPLGQAATAALEDQGTPTYDGLPLPRYVSLAEMLNPMHRIWSDGRWNKLMLAHGCYWRKCSFCDVTLDYIGRYEEQSARRIVDRIEALIAETGQTGFHFVDEAAPPKILLAMAQELLKRRLTISWWGNIRFERTFTPKVAATLAASGCIAVSGGLEVASDRLLKLMNKGVTVDQVARVTHALTDAGILVHAYLMYGFPTQTEAETVESLERVRQLFAEGCLQSAYWHRFSATAHSPVGRDPSAFGIRLLPLPEITFAHNDLPFEDPTGVDHDRLGRSLHKATYNFMHGVGLESDVREWFEFPVARPKVPRDLIRRALAARP